MTAEDAGAVEAGAVEAGWVEADDDRTAETLAWLRRKRRAHRRQQGRDLAVLLYTLVLAAVAYGSGVAVHFLRGLNEGADYGGFGEGLVRAVPALFTLLGGVLALVAARDALWRGPVVVPGPSVGWLLAQPVRRGAVLRPWFRLSAWLALAPGAAGGLVGAVALRVTGRAPIGEALAAALPGALCLPLLAVALGMAVERRARWARAVRRWSGPALLLLIALAGQTWAAGAGHRVRALEWVELWAGPWGWAAQPVVRACGGAAPGWPAAVALLVVATAAAVAHAHRDAAAVPTAQLRVRAATATTVASVAWSLELRAAKLALMEAGGGQSGRLVRLRPPRGRSGRRLAVVWRDALALLRAPGRLGRAALWAAAAAGAAGLGADLGGERRPVGLVVGLLCGYLAVGALAEPARVETDDLRRSAWSPYRLRTLMLQHGVVPLVLGVVLAVLAAVPFAVRGEPWALVLMPVCVPPFTVAALYGACRGPARTQLMFLGGGSPVGSPGPLIYLAWYAAGPLVSVVVLALVLDPAVVHPSAADAARAAWIAALLTTALTLVVRRSADRLLEH
ncbi:hypothetical protein V2S66_07740 [Streptomyces sp. V4-01]|uniref:ABC-2 type transport system permease protein n=1 Tax=Actinacidiphila polyblastidii TaxID=3110430 RepID=A0ABU7P7S8_9ACTN|nr:hypothetical protein [Streptomyces sp. V4-01]